MKLVTTTGGKLQSNNVQVNRVRSANFVQASPIEFVARNRIFAPAMKATPGLVAFLACTSLAFFFCRCSRVCKSKFVLQNKQKNLIKG